MKFKGTQTIFTDVDISTYELKNTLHQFILKGMPGEYINKDGFWEIDYGGHGSGYREIQRAATNEEKELMKAWHLIKLKLNESDP